MHGPISRPIVPAPAFIAHALLRTFLPNLDLDLRIRLVDGGWHSTDGGWRLTDGG